MLLPQASREVVCALSDVGLPGDVSGASAYDASRTAAMAGETRITVETLLSSVCTEESAGARAMNSNDQVDAVHPAMTGMAPDSLPGLIEGVGVHYVAYNMRHLAAIVIGHDGGLSYSRADLAVFTNLFNVNGVKNFGLQFHQDVEYSEEPKPGTWHWIERA